MQAKETINITEKLSVGYHANTGLSETVPWERARLRIEHHRPRDWKKLDAVMEDLLQSDPFIRERIMAKGARVEKDGIWVPDPKSYLMVDEPEEVLNQITNSGRDQLHLQGYGLTGLATVGTNYIGLTNTAITPGPTDTSLSGEITSNGLSRTQGSYTHTTGTNVTTVANTFTATGSQSCQAGALFNAAGPPVAGVMNHELTFTGRSLISGDTLAVSFQITLG
jgi:hypothetical protein